MIFYPAGIYLRVGREILIIKSIFCPKELKLVGYINLEETRDACYEYFKL